MATGNPFLDTERRPHTDGPFHANEVGLSNRNSGILLETLRHDVTPTGLHYLLNHFDVPYVADGDGRCEMAGLRARRPASLEDIKRLPARTLRVTLECAGNGRAAMTPRYPSMPWIYEAVGTAEWTGTPLRHVLERAGLLDDVVRSPSSAPTAASTAATSMPIGRSLTREVALSDDVLARLGHERRAAAAAARISRCASSCPAGTAWRA